LAIVDRFPAGLNAEFRKYCGSVPTCEFHAEWKETFKRISNTHRTRGKRQRQIVPVLN
jgi:hypothetical protein